MKKRIVLSIVIAVFIIMFVECKKSKDKINATENDSYVVLDEQEPQPIATKPKPIIENVQEIKFKELSLGMDFDKAKSTLDNSIVEIIPDYEKKDVGTGKTLEATIRLLSEKYDGYKIDEESYCPGLYLIAKNDKNELTYLYIPGGLVEKLFKVADMAGKDFVQMFVDSYKIPEMKSILKQVDNNSYTAWEYTSPKGEFLRIEDDKTILLRKAIERSFN